MVCVSAYEVTCDAKKVMKYTAAVIRPMWLYAFRLFWIIVSGPNWPYRRTEHRSLQPLADDAGQ